MVAYLIAKAIHHGGRAAAPHIANAGRAAAPHLASAARGAVHIARSASAALPTPVFPAINPDVIRRIAVPAAGGTLAATGAVIGPHVGRTGAAATKGVTHAGRAAAGTVGVHQTVGHTIAHEGGRLAAEGVADEVIHLGVEKGIKTVQEHRKENAARERAADVAS
jgi:hypothetical protein